MLGNLLPCNCDCLTPMFSFLSRDLLMEFYRMGRQMNTNSHPRRSFPYKVSAQSSNCNQCWGWEVGRNREMMNQLVLRKLLSGIMSLKQEEKQSQRPEKEYFLIDLSLIWHPAFSSRRVIAIIKHLKIMLP